MCQLKGEIMITKNLVSYNYLESYNIHEFIFSESSRWAMDEYIEFIHELYEEHFKDQEFRVILDISQSGMLPIRYSSAIMEKTVKELAPFPKPHIAYLSDDTTIHNLISTVNMGASSRGSWIQYSVTQRSQAIEWLAAATV